MNYSITAASWHEANCGRESDHSQSVLNLSVCTTFLQQYLKKDETVFDVEYIRSFWCWPYSVIFKYLEICTFFTIIKICNFLWYFLIIHPLPFFLLLSKYLKICTFFEHTPRKFFWFFKIFGDLHFFWKFLIFALFCDIFLIIPPPFVFFYHYTNI